MTDDTARSAFTGDALDLDLLQTIHRGRGLFLARALTPEEVAAAAADGQPALYVSFSLDGDVGALVEELLNRARFATRVRAAAARNPGRNVRSVMIETDALMAREAAALQRREAAQAGPEES